MARHVFPTGEIPHLWMHAAQRDARNPQGNLFFIDDTIYSYRTSWPLARIYRDKHGKAALVLGNSDRYSTTTGKHQGEVHQAVPDAVPYISVPHCMRDTWAVKTAERDRQNVAHLVGLAASALTSAQRALRVFGVGWRRSDAERAIANARAYMDYFKMRGKRPVFPAADWDAARARAERIENPDPASASARERAAAKRRAASGQVAEYREAMKESMQAAGYSLGYRATHGKRWPAALARCIDRAPESPLVSMARRADWRLFGAFGTREPGYGSGPCMLRVVGEEIETSQGARIPIAAAPMVWAAVERVRQRGKDWAPSGLAGLKIGEYAVDGIAADGALTVGCHRIPHSELRIMARALNLAACGVQS